MLNVQFTINNTGFHQLVASSKVFVKLFSKSWPSGRTAGGIKEREGKVVWGGVGGRRCLTPPTYGLVLE